MDGRIEQAKRGDRDALGSLVREHYARVYRFCARRIGEDWAPDAAQETFVTMQRSLKRFAGASAFETWLLGIAHNQCRTLARKRRLAPLQLEAWIADPTSQGNEPELGSPLKTEGSYQAVIDRESLRCALSKLSEEHREVVLLHEVEGLRYSEIAEILGVPEGTVKSRLHHAFLNMRGMLSES